MQKDELGGGHGASAAVGGAKLGLSVQRPNDNLGGDISVFTDTIEGPRAPASAVKPGRITQAEMID